VSPLVLCGIGLLGGLGAVARVALDRAVAARVGRGFPWGTLTVNLSGAFALGLLAGATADANATRLAATGLLGAFTTFSTWAFESHRLGDDGRMRLGAANFAVSLLLGVGAAWLGRHLGAAL
jgi:CrcB protein